MKEITKVLLIVILCTSLYGCTVSVQPDDEYGQPYTDGDYSFETERYGSIHDIRAQREKEIAEGISRLWEEQQAYPVVGAQKGAKGDTEQHGRASFTPSANVAQGETVNASAPMKNSAGIKLKEPLVIAAITAISTAAPDIQEAPPAKGAPRIKIVSGDGMPLSAKELSRELKKLGYNVDRVDVAPYTFQKPVVFYAPGFKEKAETLAGAIKATGGTRLLSWKSIYDIIIVSVN